MNFLVDMLVSKIMKEYLTQITKMLSRRFNIKRKTAEILLRGLFFVEEVFEVIASIVLMAVVEKQSFRSLKRNITTVLVDIVEDIIKNIRGSRRWEIYV